MPVGAVTDAGIVQSRCSRSCNRGSLRTLAGVVGLYLSLRIEVRPPHPGTCRLLLRSNYQTGTLFHFLIPYAYADTG